MKKTILIVLVYMLMIGCMFISSNATSGRIRVESVEAKPGETIDVNVVVQNNPGIVATLIRAEYDVSALTLTGVDNGTVFPDGAEQFGSETDQIPYIMLWEDGLSTENYTNEGVLATLHFVIKKDAAAGKYKIILQIDEKSTFNVDLDNVTFTLENGDVRVHDGSLSGPMIVAGCAVVAAAVCGTVLTVVCIRKRRKAETEA